MSKSKGTITRAADEALIRATPLAQMRRSPTHPGEVFRHDYREAVEPRVSQAEAARRLGWSTNRMNEFEVGKRGVTVENAIQLSELTGTTPEFWLRLQMNYDWWHGLQNAKHIKRIAPGARFPIRTAAKS
jgi:addiction module HigA family antidote